MKTKLLYDLRFSQKFVETCTSNYLPLISSQPLCIFETGNILSSGKIFFWYFIAPLKTIKRLIC